MSRVRELENAAINIAKTKYLESKIPGLRDL
jgi:hypothetical protein